MPTPRVCSDQASQKTIHRRSASLQALWESISGGSSSAQFLDEARDCSQADQEALIEELQNGAKVVIPASESLAMKADLIVPWNKLRIVRRYMTHA